MRPDVETRGRRGPARSMAGRGVAGGSSSVEWYTPPGIIRAIGLDYDLDPCSPPEGLPWIPAQRRLSLEQDGLAQRWEGRVWLNPPYGRETDAWLARFVEHGDGVALVFARTETEWFQRHALGVDAWCLIRGRLTFVDRDLEPATFNSGAPSVLLAAGEECARAVIASGLGISVAITDRAGVAQASLFG